jgi:hypothetical protein
MVEVQDDNLTPNYSANGTTVVNSTVNSTVNSSVNSTVNSSVRLLSNNGAVTAVVDDETGCVCVPGVSMNTSNQSGLLDDTIVEDPAIGLEDKAPTPSPSAETPSPTPSPTCVV